MRWSIYKVLPLFLWAIFLGVPARAQSAQPIPPDCVLFINFTANGSGTLNTSAFDNRNWQCESWTIGYQPLGGTGSITGLTVQSAPATAMGAPGSWVTYPGMVVTGINPNTDSDGAVTQLENGAVVTPFLRVLLDEGSFVGQMTGVLYGWRTRGNANSSGGGMGMGCPDPCTVIQPDAADLNATVVGPGPVGMPVEGDPVRVGASDGTNTRNLLSDTGGRLPPALASVAGADGVSNTLPTNTTEAGVQLYSRILPYMFNGATNDREFVCTTTAPVAFSAASGTLQIVGLTAATVIRICSISLASDTVTNVTFVNGTGANCGTGTASLSGVYQNVLTLSLAFPQGAFRVPSANAFCITSSATATIGGMVSYVKF